jgi:hypothetical protein
VIRPIPQSRKAVQNENIGSSPKWGKRKIIMTPITKLNVTVTYKLSATGQKAALLAGRPASEKVTEVMVLDDLSLMDVMDIGEDGSISYTADVCSYVGGYSAPVLNASPESISEIVAIVQEWRAGIQIRVDAQRAEEETAAAKQAAEEKDKLEKDGPLVDALIAEIGGSNPLALLAPGISIDWYHRGGILHRDGYKYSLTSEQSGRVKDLAITRIRAKAAQEEAAKAAKQAKREALIDEHGGMYWESATMCNFLGYDLWAGGQSKRWVGIFRQAKGISRFLDSPRGEFTFDVSDLSTGDCIQGGGYDTNSRGKRRNESEWFGVVVKNDDTGLVVRQCNSRSEALKVSPLMG